MIDPYVQQTQAAMYMNPWEGFMTNPWMMSGGPQGYMDPNSISNMQNQFGGWSSGVGSSPYAEMYDNPFTTSIAMQKLNIVAPPRGANFAGFQAYTDNIAMGTGASVTSTAMDLGGGLMGGYLGSLVGQALIPIPFVGSTIGGLVGAALGSPVGKMLGNAYANRAGREVEIHRALMELGNANSPYGGGFGYSTKDARNIYRGIEDMAIDDPYFGAGDISRILDEGIKTGNIKGTSNVSDIKRKLKNLKETAKSLVEIFGNSDISEIMDNLRRLNGTGLTNAQAVEVSRTMGMAARAMGMKEENYFNQEMQKAQIGKNLGIGTEYSIARMDSESLLAYKYNPDVAKNFINNDDFIKKREHVMQDYAMLMSGSAGVYQLVHNNRTTEAGYDVLAEAQAITDAGGKDKFDSLSRKERIKYRKKAMNEILERADNGESLYSMAGSLFKSGAMSPTAYEAFIGANQKTLIDLVSSFAGDFNTGPEFDKRMAANISNVLKHSNKWVWALAGISPKTYDRDIAKVFDSIDNRKMLKGNSLEKFGEKLKELTIAGSFESQFHAFLTEMSSWFGRSVNKLESHLKVLGVKDLEMTTMPSNNEIIKIQKLLSKPYIRKILENNGLNGDLSSMFTTGDPWASLFNNRGLLNSTPNRDVLKGIGNEAHLGHNWLGSSVDAAEILAMGKSGLWNRENIAKRMDKASDIFRDYYSGKIGIKAFQNELSNLNGNVMKNIALFSQDNATKKILLGNVQNYKEVTKKLMKDNSGLFELGLLSPYEISLDASKAHKGMFSSVTDEFYKIFGKNSKMASGVKAVSQTLAAPVAMTRANILGGAADVVDTINKAVDNPKSNSFFAKMSREFAGLLHSFASTEQDYAKRSANKTFKAFDNGKHSGSLIKDMREIASASLGYEQRVLKVEQAIRKVDYGQLKKDIDKNGLFKGVDKYIQDSGIAKGMSEGEKSVLRSALRVGHGDKTRTQANLQQQYIDAMATMSSGTDINSAMAAFGIHIHGGVNVNQIEHLATMLKKHVGTANLVNRGYSVSAANKFQDTLAEKLLKNKNIIATTSHTPFYLASSMFSDLGKGKFAAAERSIVNDKSIGSAVLDFLGYNKEKQEKIFKAAQDMHNSFSKGKDNILGNAIVESDNRAKYSKLTEKEYQTARKLSNIAYINKINLKTFSDIGAKTKVAHSALAIARIGTGEMLDTAESQARAVGMLGFLKKDEQGKFRAMTGDEAMEAYKQAIQKKAKNRSYSDQLIIAAGESAKAKDGKAFTGQDILSELSLVSGLGETLKTIAHNINLGMDNRKESRSVSLLEKINTNLSNLVRMEQKKAGGKSVVNLNTPKNSSGLSIQFDNETFNEKNMSSTKNITKDIAKKIPKQATTPLKKASEDNYKQRSAIANKIIKEQSSKKTIKAKIKAFREIEASNNNDESMNLIYYRKSHKGDSNERAKTKIIKQANTKKTLQDEYQDAIKKARAIINTNKEKIRKSLNERYSKISEENYHSKIFNHMIGIGDGGSRAANLGHTHVEQRRGGRDPKRDLAVQANTLLERIAVATEAIRDAIKNSPPLIRPGH